MTERKKVTDTAGKSKPKGRKKMATTRKKAMDAQCFECSGGYEDGKVDCECTKCPLYLFMPYRKLEADLSWKKWKVTQKGGWNDAKPDKC